VGVAWYRGWICQTVQRERLGDHRQYLAGADFTFTAVAENVPPAADKQAAVDMTADNYLSGPKGSLFAGVLVHTIAPQA
jgi:hypothetical protein